jgi:hypothetical protein
MPPENTRLWGRVFLFDAALPAAFVLNAFAFKAVKSLSPVACLPGGDLRFCPEQVPLAGERNCASFCLFLFPLL